MPRVLGVDRQEAVERQAAPVVNVVAPVAMVVAWWPLAVFRCRLFVVVAVLEVAVAVAEQGLPVAVPAALVVALHTRLRTAQCRTLLRKESAAHVQMVCSVVAFSPPSPV